MSYGDKSDSEMDNFEVELQKSLQKPKKNILSYKYPNHKITIRIGNKSFEDDEIVLE